MAHAWRMKMLRMNRKGAAPAMTLLFFIIFITSLMLVFYFINFNSSIGDKSSEMASVLEEVEFSQQYMTAEATLLAQQSILKEGDVKENFKSFAKTRDFGVESFGNFYGKIRNGEFEIRVSESGYLLEIKNLFAASRRGMNDLKRDFNLTIEFDGKGAVQKIYK